MDSEQQILSGNEVEEEGHKYIDGSNNKTLTLKLVFSKMNL